MPSRRAWIAWPSSCRSSDPKKRKAATTAMARYVVCDSPGFVEGKTLDSSDQVISPKTISQLQLSANPDAGDATEREGAVNRAATVAAGIGSAGRRGLADVGDDVRDGRA